MNFVDSIFALRIDGWTRQKDIRVGFHSLEHVVVADQKVGVLAIEQTGLIVESIHAEQHRLRNMA
jgi:hypothetical protein